MHKIELCHGVMTITMGAKAPTALCEPPQASLPFPRQNPWAPLPILRQAGQSITVKPLRSATVNTTPNNNRQNKQITHLEDGASLLQ